MSINKDQVKGRVKEVTGAAKEGAGKITRDKAMEGDGRLQKKLGKVQSAIGDFKSDVKDSAKSSRRD